MIHSKTTHKGPRMTYPLATPTQEQFKHARLSRLPFARTLAALAGFLLVLIPSAAQAEDPARTIQVTVAVGDETNSRTLSNTKIRVLAAPGEETEITSATTNASGIATLEFEATQVEYTIEADWLTAPGTLNVTDTINPSEDAHTFYVAPSYGYATGNIQALVGETPLENLTGASVQILAGAQVVQTLPLTADGAFESEVLPRLPSGYSIQLIPPAGYALADEQNQSVTGFEIPELSADPNMVTVDRTFLLISTTPVPEPEPEPAPTTPAPAPKPATPQGAPVARFPTPMGSIPGLSFATGTDATPAQGPDFLSLTQQQLEDLLKSINAATGPLLFTNNLNQIIGIGYIPTDEQQRQLRSLLAGMLPRAAVNGQANGVEPTDAVRALASTALTLTSPVKNTANASSLLSSDSLFGANPSHANPTSMSTLGSINNISIASMDLETALMAVQRQRASLLETQLKTQIEDTKSKNDLIADLNVMLSVMNSYVINRSAASYESAVAALRAKGSLIGYDAAKLDSFKYVPKPPEGEPVDPFSSQAIQDLKSSIDSMANSQQMDMIRLQSLTSKRNEAFDVMANFVKKMQDSRSSIVGNMRSTPTDLGAIKWNKGTVSAPFDLSQIAPGEHHGLFKFEDLGFSFVTEVTVTGPQLADTGISTKLSVGISSALVLFGALLVVITERRLRKPERSV